MSFVTMCPYDGSCHHEDTLILTSCVTLTKRAIMTPNILHDDLFLIPFVIMTMYVIITTISF